MAARSWSGVSHPFMRPAGRPGVSRILDGRLLIGEYPTPDDIDWLRDEHGIQAVVSLQDDIDLTYKSIDLPSLEGAYAKAGIPLHRFGVIDGDPDDLIPSLEAILARLHELLGENRRVYVHCNAGYNRAPSVAIAYLHAHHGLSLDEAHSFVRERRACAPYLSALRRHFDQ
ncbi:MAG: dual specificity protein phosphatase family protein [Candidatus Binatia bacterium]|nr:dual specificity protein phosphatase family protein [Candidatus Binatia bacterium]